MILALEMDGSSDDYIAALLALRRPGVKVAGITVPDTGEVVAKIGAENTAHLLKKLNLSDIPVAYSDSAALSPDGKPFPQYLRDAVNKIFDKIDLNKLSIDPLKETEPLITDSAVALIKRIIEENQPDKITIIATGPLTNIAEFIQTHHTLTNQIEKIVIMGGAINPVKGNIRDLDENSPNEVAEWNIYADPKAADIVFRSGIPITLVPLNATNKVPVTLAFYESLQYQQLPELRLVYDLLHIIVKAVGKEVFRDKYFLWDPLAMMVCLGLVSVTTEKMKIKVNLTTAETERAAPEENIPFIEVVTDVHEADKVLEKLANCIYENFKDKRAHLTGPNNMYQKLNTGDTTKAVSSTTFTQTLR